MKKLILYALLSMTAVRGYGQTYRPLALGDTVPNLELEMANYKSSKARLADFKGKLLLLDFWATWCTACIGHFPELEALQTKFGPKMQVLLVNTKSTGDDKTKTTHFFETKFGPSRKKYTLPSVVADTVLDVLFKHRSIPHYVWLNEKGKVLAITDSKYINGENIAKALNSESLNLPVKRDNFTAQKQLFKDGNGVEPESYTFRSILTKYNESLSQGRLTDRDIHGQYVRFIAVNTDILSVYGQAYPEIGSYSTRKRLLWELKEPNKYRWNGTDDFAEWQQKNAVTYEIIVPPCTKEKLQQYIREDLVRYFGLSIQKEIRKVKCLVLINVDRSKNPITKLKAGTTNIMEDDSYERKYIHNFPAGILLDFYFNKLNLPVVDESYIKGNVDMDLPGDLLDLPKVRKALQRYGLDLVEEARLIDVVVLKK